MATLGNVLDVTTAGPRDAWTLSHEEDRTVLRSWRGGMWSDLKTDAELSDIDSEAPGSLWAVSKDKVLHHDGTRWTDHTPATDALFTSIAVADDGSVWVGTDRHYVLTFADDRWSRSRVPVPAKVEDEESADAVRVAMGRSYIPLKAETENGEAITEPSEDALFGLIVELAYPDNTFVIIESDEEDPAWFASVALLDGGGYEVEYRDVLHRYQRLTTGTDPNAIALDVTVWTASISRAHDARRRNP